MQHSWNRSCVLTTAAAGVLWTAGAVLYLGEPISEAQHIGVLLVLGGVVVTVLGVLRSWHLRMRRAFVHGYHAGFHDATTRELPHAAKDCEVLDLSELKVRRLTRLG